MANSYFKFKQFTILQDKCAMKVCTDACLFGALVANNIFSTSTANDTLQCLDIGTGTGLLSLMAAQQNKNINIDAIEIVEPAAEQAGENIAASHWTDRIQVFNEDILNFLPGKQYDCIFSNPPFYEDDLKSAVKAKNNAKHDTSLSLLQLLHIVDSYLTTDGFFSVLLPYHRVDYFIEESIKTGFHLTRQILVKQTLKHKFFRGILFLNRKETEPELSEITIRDTEHNYTPEFSATLKDYYLFL
jgi:tRNA1Val (adenine37-N6)-methyltransferase